MLKSIFLKNIRNIKGEAEQELTGLDIFNGGIGSGKSTRLDAIPLTILGYLPVRGKALETVFMDSNSNEMSVGLANLLDSGIIFEAHRIFKNDSGKYQQSIKINGEILSNAEGEKQIADVFGKDIFVFNLGEFLNLSSNKRKDFIFNLSALPNKYENLHYMILEKACRKIADDGTVNGILQYKYNKESFLDLDDSEIEEAWRILTKEKADIITLYIRKILDTDHQDKQQYLNNLFNAFNDDLKTQRKIKHGSEAVNTEIRRMQQQLKAAENLPQLLESKKKLQDEITRIKVRIAENDKNKEVIEQYQKRGERIKLALQQLTRFDKKAKQKEIERLDEVIVLINKYVAEYTELQIQYKENDKQILGFEKTLYSIKNIGSKKFCVLSNQIICDTDLKGAAKNISKLLEENTIRAAEIKGKIEWIENVLAEQFGNAWKPIETLINRLEKQKSNLQVEIDENAKEIIFYQKEQKEWESTDVSKFNVADNRILIQQLDALVNQMADMENKIGEQQSVKEKILTLEAANISAIEAEKRIELDKQLIESVRDIMNMIVAEQIDPISGVVNQILHTINLEYNFQMYLDDKNELSFGWQKKDGFTPFEALSGGETVLFAIALITALIICKKPPIKILCVKAAEINLEYFELMLTGLKSLKSLLDNILVEYPHQIKESYEGWKVWKL